MKDAFVVDLNGVVAVVAGDGRGVGRAIAVVSSACRLFTRVTTEDLTESEGAWMWQGAATRATSVFSDDGKTRPATTSDQTTASAGCRRCR